MKPSQRISFSIFFLISSFEAFGAMFLLYSIPADPKNIRLFGLSTSRMVLLLGLLVIALLLYYLGWHSFKKAPWVITLESRLISACSYSNTCFTITSTLFIFFINTIYFYCLILAEQFGEWQATFYRFSPLILWAAIFLFQASILFAFLFKERIKTSITRISKLNSLIFLCVFLVIIFLTFWIGITGIGLTPDIVAWGSPGTPVLLWQVLLAIDIVWLFYILTLFITIKIHAVPKWFDALLCLLLWLCAVIIWENTPFISSYFAPQPVPPNYEFYPYSDAALHDVNAQFLLIGEGLGGNGGSVIRRPLYSLFLALFHIIAGQQYNQVALIQILLLGLMPVWLYLIGGFIHNRFSGLISAVLFIFQEHNGISLSNVINVSHSKLLMSDAFTAFWIMVYTLIILVWKRHRGSLFLLCLAGGVLGAAMLVRPQAVFLAIVLLIVILFDDLPHYKRFIFHILLFSLGTLCVISPWIIRNYRLTHTIVFDEPSSAQIGMIAQRYNLAPSDEDEALRHLPGEKEGEYSARMAHQIINFALQHPNMVISFASAHFFHNIVNLVDTLPISFEPISPEEYVRSQPYWLDLDRKNFQIKPPYEDKLSLGLVLLCLILGFTSAFTKDFNRKSINLYALIPMFVYLFYNLSNAVSRNSGWRFLLPGDWVAIVYYSCGISAFILIINYIFNGASTWLFSPILFEPIDQNRQGLLDKIASNKYSVLLTLMALILFGSLIPLSEGLFPKRYSEKTKTEIIDMLSNSKWAKDNPNRYESIIHIGLEDSTFVLWGKALYPRFYPANVGITSGSPNALTRIRDYNRLSFLFISEHSRYILLPINEPPPQFPNGSDVIVIGCNAGDHISAYLAAYADESSYENKKWSVITQDVAAIPFCQ